MPFTPVHMGPGMLFKAAIPRHFSLVVFGLTQVALDLEVLRYLIGQNPPLHRFWHTYVGATLVAVVFAALGKPCSQIIKFLWNKIARSCSNADVSVTVYTSWTAAIVASVLGTYSHIILDSLFHPDMEPFQPWSDRNPLLGLISPMMLQIACVFLGAFGLAWFFSRKRA